MKRLLSVSSLFCLMTGWLSCAAQAQPARFTLQVQADRKRSWSPSWLLASGGAGCSRGVAQRNSPGRARDAN